MGWSGLPSNLHAGRFPIENYADKEWDRIESRAGGALERLAGTVFVMLVVFLVVAFVVSRSGALLLLRH